MQKYSDLKILKADLLTPVLVMDKKLTCVLNLNLLEKIMRIDILHNMADSWICHYLSAS